MQLDRAVLQQRSALPQLRTADALDSPLIHQIGPRCLGEAVLFLPLLLAFAVDEFAAQLLESALQPLIQKPVGAALAAGWFGQGDGVAEIAPMQNGSSSGGTSYYWNVEPFAAKRRALVVP